MAEKVSDIGSLSRKLVWELPLGAVSNEIVNLRLPGERLDAVRERSCILPGREIVYKNSHGSGEKGLRA